MQSLAEYVKFLEEHQVTAAFLDPIRQGTLLSFDSSGSMELPITDQEAKRTKEAFEACITKMKGNNALVNDYTAFMKKPEELK